MKYEQPITTGGAGRSVATLALRAVVIAVAIVVGTGIADMATDALAEAGRATDRITAIQTGATP